MSRALDSINSLLKYKQSREQQKIDRSLAMLDLGTRLRQQEFSREEQIQRMGIAQSQEQDRIERERDANELRDLQRNELYSPEAIKRREQKQIADLKISQEQLNTIINTKSEQNVEKVFSSISRIEDEQDLKFVSRIKTNEIIPSPVFNYIENFWDGSETDLKTKIKEIAKKSDKEDEVDDFYDKTNSQAIVNSLIQAQVNSSATGRANYDNFLNVFQGLDKSYFGNQIPFMESFQNPIKKHNENKAFYSNQENRIQISNSIRQSTRNRIGKEFDELLKDISTTQDIDYVPYDIKQLLLEEGFSPEDLGL